jgi:hypothetical protein
MGPEFTVEMAMGQRGNTAQSKPAYFQNLSPFRMKLFTAQSTLISSSEHYAASRWFLLDSDRGCAVCFDVDLPFRSLFVKINL